MKQLLSKPILLRVLGLLAVIVVTLAVIFWIRSKRLPVPAPQHVQDSGMVRVHKALTDVRESPYSGTPRFIKLAEQIDKIIKKDRITFTTAIGHAGYTWRSHAGEYRIYIKVIVADNGDYQHQTPAMIADTLFHEALHTLYKGESSVEEECDAYLAGLRAQAIIEERAIEDEPRIERQPIFDYVLRTYPGLRRDKKYEPLEMPMDELARRAGITPYRR